MSIIPFERQVPTDVAEPRVQAILASLGLIELEREEYNDLRAIHYRFTRPSDGMEFAGSGKGEYFRIGGLAEVVEHHFTETQSMDDCIYVQGQDVAAIGRRLQDPLLTSLNEFGDDPILCINMEGVGNEGSATIPVRLVNPDILSKSEPESDAEAFLSRYSTNSGTAFGLTEDEALLHAIGEAYERHELSRLFLWAALGDPCPVAGVTVLHDPAVEALVSIRLDALPPARLVVDHGRGPLHFCAVVEVEPLKETGLCRVGSGASVCRIHALRRAVHEYAQLVGLEDVTTVDEDTAIRRFLAGSPMLSRLIHMEALASLPTLAAPSLDQEMSVTAKQALQTILDHPERLPALVRFSRVGDLEDATGFVCQCYCPGAERFHLTRAGSPVAPMRAFS